MGDTGLWFVPTGEVLPAKRWSFSAYRVNFDYDQGFTDVSNWPVTFGVGLGDRAEIFGACPGGAPHRPRRAPDLLQHAGQAGSSTSTRSCDRAGPTTSSATSGSAARSTSRRSVDQKPVAFAVRGLIKLPTAKDDEEGVGTGKMDFAFDAIVSKEINERVELSGLRRLHLPRRSRRGGV